MSTDSSTTDAELHGEAQHHGLQLALATYRQARPDLGALVEAVGKIEDDSERVLFLAALGLVMPGAEELVLAGAEALHHLHGLKLHLQAIAEEQH